MATRMILKNSDPQLRKHCHEVKDFNPRLHMLLDDMRQTLAESNGVGLAAPQVGVLRRAVIVLETNVPDDEEEYMIELINRGRAILVGRQDHGEKGTEILLMDGESHVFFHTWIGNDRKADESAADRQSGETILRRMDGLCKYPVEVLSLHQREFVPVAEELGYGLDMECLQAVYTRREKLPITGLYRTDGGVLENGISIRPLTMEYLDTACAVYHTVDDPEYMRGRIAKGAMYGAFIDGQMAGFMGVHDEGSIGLLEVLPEYRRRHVAMALETYVFNRFIEQGMTPYGQIVVGNEASGRLQEKMGVCFAKEHVFWLSKLLFTADMDS